MDVSTLNAKTLREYSRYLENCDYDWIDYDQAPYLPLGQWLGREEVEDPDTDA